MLELRNSLYRVVMEKNKCAFFQGSFIERRQKALADILFVTYLGKISAGLLTKLN